MIDETKQNKEKIKKILRAQRRPTEECFSDFENVLSNSSSMMGPD